MRTKKYGEGFASEADREDGGSITRKELKIGEIAQLTGVSEKDIRALIQRYESLFTYRTIGPVRIFPESAVQVARNLIELSGKGLTPEEIVREVRSVDSPAISEEPAAGIDRTAPALPPEVVIDIQVMQERLARQERRIAHLTTGIEREREERMREIEDLRETIAGLQEELAVVAEWVDYFDAQMDEVTLPASERIRRAFRGERDRGGRAGRSS
ncbi:MAG: MerR family transcriptional regulator [Methanomicrobiales archaeon]|jgi:DNA-binding transcriptional MerR regulator|nr:MerR family transcriptional regulator [Methanomicrobiales archaeon]